MVAEAAGQFLRRSGMRIVGALNALSHKASGGSPTLKCENTRHLTSSAPAALNAGD